MSSLDDDEQPGLDAMAAELLNAIRDQWISMTGMAAMFIGTIALAVWIQPHHDTEASRAFGTAGASQARFVLMELAFILLFTAAIIWLVRKGQQWVIKFGVLAILFMALMYSMMPLATMLLDHSPDEFALSTDGDGPALLMPLGDEGDGLTWDPATRSLARVEGAGGTASDGSVAYRESWSTVIANRTPDNGHMRVVEGQSDLVLCDGGRWTRVAKDSGAILAHHNHSIEAQCIVGWKFGDDLMAIRGGRTLHRFTPIHGVISGKWSLDDSFRSLELLMGRMLAPDTILLVSDQHAGIYVQDTADRDGNFDRIPLDPIWSASPPSNDNWTSAAWGRSPFDRDPGDGQPPWWELADDEGEWMLTLGTENGAIDAFLVPTGAPNETHRESRLDLAGAMDGPIRGLLVADCCRGGVTDIYVVDGDTLRMFGRAGDSMTETVLGTVEADGDIRLLLHHVPNEDWAEYGLREGVLSVASADGWSSGTHHLWKLRPLVFSPVIGAIWPATIVGLLGSLVLMVLLVVHPEWYVVNSVGILVGAGVITILGISLVPALIMLFMILAAVYDAWAVYRSKHMLTLADTMIGLKLPILLVAPQERGYSFRAEGDGRMRKAGAPSGPSTERAAPEPADVPDTAAAATRADEDAPASEPSGLDADVVDTADGVAVRPLTAPGPKQRRSRDAMFMGLGDVIFPGMLVISCLTWLPDTTLGGLPFGLWIGLGTLVGGLLGYSVLMGYVAMGRPQAGLPLLNGGSILGFFITFLILAGFIDGGWAAFGEVLFGIRF